VQEIANRNVAVVPTGLGVVTNDHDVPSQRSVNGCDPLPSNLLYEPDAIQLVALEHDTPVNSIEFEVTGAGTVFCDQVVPSKCAASGKVTPEPTEKPTASQFVTPDTRRHCTAVK
jgi:hypothetical protein